MAFEFINKLPTPAEIKEQFPRVSCPKGKKIFEVKNLNAGHLVRDINFSLYEGEIVGEFDPKKVSVEELGLYMAGSKRKGTKENG